VVFSWDELMRILKYEQDLKGTDTSAPDANIVASEGLEASHRAVQRSGDGPKLR
jgi:hypothetical protein